MIAGRIGASELPRDGFLRVTGVVFWTGTWTRYWSAGADPSGREPPVLPRRVGPTVPRTVGPECAPPTRCAPSCVRTGARPGAARGAEASRSPTVRSRISSTGCPSDLDHDHPAHRRRGAWQGPLWRPELSTVVDSAEAVSSQVLGRCHELRRKPRLSPRAPRWGAYRPANCLSPLRLSQAAGGGTTLACRAGRGRCLPAARLTARLPASSP